jgi:hypothetical protein
MADFTGTDDVFGKIGGDAQAVSIDIETVEEFTRLIPVLKPEAVQLLDNTGYVSGGDQKDRVLEIPLNIRKVQHRDSTQQFPRLVAVVVAKACDLDARCFADMKKCFTGDPGAKYHNRAA